MSLSPADLEFRPPQLDVPWLAGRISAAYGITGTMSPLRGERDQNLVVATSDGRRLLVKVAGELESPEAVDLQISILEHLALVDPQLPVPRVVPTSSGDDRAIIEGPEGRSYLARVLTFVVGDPFEDAWDLPDAVLFEVGHQQGRLAKALSDFEHPAATRFMAWDVSNGLIDDDALWATAKADIVEIAADARGSLAQETLPALASARSQVTHNDGHPGNVLRRPGTHQVAGVIDFGDAVRGAVVADVAACAGGFAAHGRHGAGRSLMAVVTGYDAALALTQSEIDMLYDVVMARFLLTSLLFDFQIAHSATHRSYALGIRDRCLADLAAWAALDPEHFRLRLHDRLTSARR